MNSTMSGLYTQKHKAKSVKGHSSNYWGKWTGYSGSLVKNCCFLFSRPPFLLRCRCRSPSRTSWNRFRITIISLFNTQEEQGAFFMLTFSAQTHQEEHNIKWKVWMKLHTSPAYLIWSNIPSLLRIFWKVFSYILWIIMSGTCKYRSARL